MMLLSIAIHNLVKMNVLHVIAVFLAAYNLFAGCQENVSDTQCILVTLSFNDNVLDILKEITNKNLNVTLIEVTTELEYELVVDYVVTEFQCNFHEIETKSDCLCSEIIGVIGDLDSSAARIIHTLAGRSNLNITLVAASTTLPVTNLALPNVLDMNPLVYYIKALVSFTYQLNWTRIALISIALFFCVSILCFYFYVGGLCLECCGGVGCSPNNAIVCSGEGREFLLGGGGGT